MITFCSFFDNMFAGFHMIQQIKILGLVQKPLRWSANQTQFKVQLWNMGWLQMLLFYLI